MLNKVLLMLSRGNRPFRVLLFGGILLAWLIMTLASRLLGIETDTRDEVSMAYILLVIISAWIGFGISIWAYSYLEKTRKRREDSKVPGPGASD